MHCPHALMVLPLLVRVPRSGGRSLLYRGDYHRHLTGTPISCIFLYTQLYLLQYFSLLLAYPMHLFYSKNLAKMPIAHLLHLFIHLYLLQFFFKLLEAHPWRPFCHNMHLQAINITDHLRKRICERINNLSLSYHAKKHALM